ncbi:MAG: hypothetical protein HYY32_06220, partial [Chloroflexi bacterium]|nr:hypothetical protein [Chloroflexota bacterium]
LSLPRGASVQVPDFIAREARRLWSVNQEESLLYWQPVAGTKGQFFVLSVPREPLHALEETVRLAGLRPVSVDLRPLCLARALNQGRAVAVCVEGNNIVIVVLVDHIPVLMQTHLLGDMPLLPEDLAGQASNLLGQALAYYNDSHAADRLSLDTPFFVCGAGAAPNLGERLHSETGFPLHEVAPLLSAPAEFPLAHFVVNLGLLMKMLQ